MRATARSLCVVMTAAFSMFAAAAVAQIQLTPQPQSPPEKNSDSGVQKRQDAKKQAPPKKDPPKSTDSPKATKAPPADRDAACARQSQCRSRLWRLPARQVWRGVPHRHATRAGARRCESDDAARRALRQWPGREPRRQEGRRLVQAGRRPRRSRGDLCPCDDAHGRTRWAGQSRRSCKTAGVRGPARQPAGRL